MLVIPTQATPAYQERILLDGSSYVIRLAWNERASFWMLDVLDADETPLLQGIVVRVGGPLNDPAAGRGPPGLFFALDSSGQDLDPGFDDLGSRVQLLYVPAAQVPAA